MTKTTYETRIINNTKLQILLLTLALLIIIGFSSLSFINQVAASLKVAKDSPKKTIEKLMGESDVTILCIGSSSTQGYPLYGAKNPDQTYPSRLEHKLRETFSKDNIAVLNKGVGGETTQQMVKRFD